MAQLTCWKVWHICRDEHEIPKLVKAPLINPHGKYRSMLVVWAAVSPNGAESLSVASVLSADGSRETRVSHRKRLSWRTKVPCIHSSPRNLSFLIRRKKIRHEVFFALPCDLFSDYQSASWTALTKNLCR